MGWGWGEHSASVHSGLFPYGGTATSVFHSVIVCWADSVGDVDCLGRTLCCTVCWTNGASDNMFVCWADSVLDGQCVEQYVSAFDSDLDSVFDSVLTECV